MFDTLIHALLDALPRRVQIGCMVVFGAVVVGGLIWMLLFRA